MARQRDSNTSRTRRRTATSPEQREMQLADAAYDLAEEQIHNGTASSQVITHFLRMGSTRERLEQEQKRHEIELMEVKKQELEGRQRMESMFTEAIQAFRGYAGLPEGGEVMDGEFTES